MPPPLRLRYLGCANALNRHGEHCEKTLEKRLKCDPPATGKPSAEPVNDLSEADAGVTLQQAQNVISAYRDRLTAARAAAGPQPPPAPAPGQVRRGTSPLMQAILEGGVPNGAARPG
jgi:hypothetical protein